MDLDSGPSRGDYRDRPLPVVFVASRRRRRAHRDTTGRSKARHGGFFAGRLARIIQEFRLIRFNAALLKDGIKRFVL